MTEIFGIVTKKLWHNDRNFWHLNSVKILLNSVKFDTMTEITLLNSVKILLNSMQCDKKNATF